MAVTPLTLYGWVGPSPALASAGGLTATSGAGSTSAVASRLGTALGVGEVTGLGTTAPWAALQGPPGPTQLGFAWDASTLDNQQLVAGAWSISLALSTDTVATTLTADIIARVSVLQATTGAIVPYGTLTLAGQTLTNTPASYVLTGTLPAISLGTGDRLYVGVYLNVTANANALSTLGVAVGLATTSATGTAATAWTTPGYQPLTSAQLLTGYQYGGFPLNDGVAYLLLEKPLDLPEYRQSLFKIARLEGMKKSGETVNERRIAIKLQVIGTSRADLESKLDALYTALAVRQQALTLHSLDGRYWIADCLSATAQLVPGRVLSVVVAITFVAAQPYPYAAAGATFATGSILPTAGGGQYQSPVYAIVGGGVIYCRPTIVVKNLTLTNSVTLTPALLNGNNYTSLAVSPTQNAVAVGDSFLLSNSGHTQTVVASATAAAGATTLTVTSFTANFSYPGAGATSVVKIVALTSITVTQSTDGQSITVPGLALRGGVNQDYITITCDPLAALGYTVTENALTTPLAFTGIFPIQEPGLTSWQVFVSCASIPTISATWTWTPRYLT